MSDCLVTRSERLVTLHLCVRRLERQRLAQFLLGPLMALAFTPQLLLVPRGIVPSLGADCGALGGRTARGFLSGMLRGGTPGNRSLRSSQHLVEPGRVAPRRLYFRLSRRDLGPEGSQLVGAALRFRTSRCSVASRRSPCLALRTSSCRRLHLTGAERR
jgi:hypothetical protein